MLSKISFWQACLSIVLYLENVVSEYFKIALFRLLSDFSSETFCINEFSHRLFFSTIHYFAEYLPAASLSFNYLIFRSSRPYVFCKNGVLRNFAKFTGKHLCQSLYFNKVAGLRPATLLKKRLWHRCFPVNFVKFLRNLFLQNTSGGCFSIIVQFFVNNWIINN